MSGVPYDGHLPATMVLAETFGMRESERSAAAGIACRHELCACAIKHRIRAYEGEWREYERAARG